MVDESYDAAKSDFIKALRIIYREGLSDAFAHLSMRSNDGNEMLFMPRKSPALVKSEELFFVDFDKPVPQSSLHQAIYKARPDVKAVFHFHSPGGEFAERGRAEHSAHAQLQRNFLRGRAAPTRGRGRSNRRRGRGRGRSSWEKALMLRGQVRSWSGSRFGRVAY